ncbi:MAG TPA: helix-turn-helix domain-containing protein [Solirubrobacteraceae bacterium]|nr:helix-turn-helix domain-containing protein [Solirubrobacteraceae bacterium]
MATSSGALRRARRTRERDIVAATRALFDDLGMQDARIEKIARAVGINKALIYRHFASKDELFVATVTLYLDELAERLHDVDRELDHAGRLREGWGRYADFCLQYPAFLDCALSLMRRPASELREGVPDAIWLRLGQAMGACIGPLAAILADGAEAGVFDVDDPDFVANRLYAQTLGTMHLARIGAGVVGRADALPGMFEIDAERVRDACVADALAAVGVR